MEVLQTAHDDATNISRGCFKRRSVLLLVGLGFWIFCQDMREFCYIPNFFLLLLICCLATVAEIYCYNIAGDVSGEVHFSTIG
jgi:hypothetical protein